jgi:hypothetical protein
MRHVRIGKCGCSSGNLFKFRDAVSASKPKDTTASKEPEAINAENQRFR